MELRFGNKYVVEMSFVISLFFSFWLYIVGLFSQANYLVIVVFISLFYTMPGFLRFLFCLSWKSVDAIVEKSEDISKETIDWRSVVVSHPCHKAKIKYHIENTEYKNTITSRKSFGKTCRIYYRPNNPSIIAKNRGLGWRGSICLFIIFLVILYKLFPNFFLFDLLKRMLKLIASLKK